MHKKGIINFELRILFTQTNQVIIIGLLILMIFSIWFGIIKYQTLLSINVAPQASKNDGDSLCNQYTSISNKEIENPFNTVNEFILFHNTAILTPPITRFNQSGKCNIIYSVEEKNPFYISSQFLDFSRLMILCSSLIALFYGYDGTRNKQFLRYISDLSEIQNPTALITITRLTLLNLFFVGLLSLTFFVLYLIGYQFRFTLIFGYIVLLAVNISFFALIGAFTATLKSTNIRFVLLPFFYLILNFLLPWMLQAGVYLEMEKALQPIDIKINNLFNQVAPLKEKIKKTNFSLIEKDSVSAIKINEFINNLDNLNEKIQLLKKKRFDFISNRIQIYLLVASLFPTTLYQSTSTELTGNGFQYYIEFYRQFHSVNQNLISPLSNTYPSSLQAVSSKYVIEKNFNLFYGHSGLPKYYPWGILLNLLYIFTLFGSIYRKQVHNSSQIPLQTVNIDFSSINSMFALCKDNQIKNQLIREIGGLENTVTIEKIPVTFQFRELKIRTILDFFSIIAKVDRKLLNKNLEILGINNFNKITPSPEEILKLYLSVKISRKNVSLIILNDFFKKETPAFERECIKLLSFMKISGIKILYLSCEMYHSNFSLEDSLKIDTFQLFPLPLDEITLG